MDKNKIIVRELTALGQYWRNDWSDFDGRSLRSDLEDLTNWFENETDVEFTEFTEMLKRQEENF